MVTYGRFHNVITVDGLKQCVNEGVNTSDLADETLVDLVVTRQVWQDASDACHDVDVWWCQQLNQLYQQSLHTLPQQSQQLYSSPSCLPLIVYISAVRIFFRIELNSNFSIRFETSTIIRNFWIRTVTDSYLFNRMTPIFHLNNHA